MFRALVVAGGLLLVGVSGAHALTIFADDFESDTVGLNASLNNWTVTQGSIDVIGSNFYQWYGPGHYIDLNGSSFQAGRIDTQPLTLKFGALYALEFDYANNVNSNGREAIGFGIGGAYDEIVLNGPVPAMIHYVFRFIARQSPANLFFADVGTTPDDNGGPILDNVKLEQLTGVPLPATGLLLTGAVGLVGLKRRKRA